MNEERMNTDLNRKINKKIQIWLKEEKSLQDQLKGEDPFNMI